MLFRSGPIATIGGLQSGQGYTPGIYTNVNAIGVYGTGAKLTVTVDATGRVASAVLTVAGTGYAANTGLTANIGPGYGFAVFITSVTPTTPLGQPQWARPPRRYNQFAANPTATPPQYVNNPLAIQYSYMAPQADTPITPPIDYVT